MDRVIQIYLRCIRALHFRVNSFKALSLPRHLIFQVFATGFVTFFILSWFLIYFPANGDTYMYASSLLTFKGSIIHSGYIIIGAIPHYVLKAFNVTPLETLVYISIISGSISTSAIFLLTYRLTKDRVLSALASVILLFSGAFWYFSIHGEVYIPQLAFVLLSTVSLLYGRFLLSSALFLIAISITPTSVLLFPVLLYLLVKEHRGIKHVLLFFLPLIATAVLALVVFYEKIFKTILWAVHLPDIFIKKLTIVSLVKEIVYRLALEAYGISFGIMMIPAVLGLLLLWKKNRYLFFINFWFILPFSLYILNLGLLTGDHLIITFIPLSISASVFLRYPAGLNKSAGFTGLFIAGLFLFAHISLSYFCLISPRINEAKEISKVSEKLNSLYKDNDLLLSDHTFGRQFWYNRLNNQNHPGESFNMYNLQRDMKWITVRSIGSALTKNRIDEILLTKKIFFVDCGEWIPEVILRQLGDETQKRRKKVKSYKNRLKNHLNSISSRKTRFKQIIASDFRPVYYLELLE